MALNVSYDKAYEELQAAGRKSSRRFNFNAYASKHPLLSWVPLPANKGQTRLKLSEFPTVYGEGRYIARVAKHVCAVVDGVLIDESPPLHKCVYGYWKVVALAPGEGVSDCRRVV